jgi:hypothetical protein
MSDSDSSYETASSTASEAAAAPQEEEITDLTNAAVVTKYRMAADIANRALDAPVSFRSEKTAGCF